MERDGQHTTRHIVLGRSKAGSYIWTCTDCEWEHPFHGPNQTPGAPLEAISDFYRHSCAAYQLDPDCQAPPAGDVL